MDDLVVEHVLRAVECIPPGRVASYGMIAELVGGTPRQVGSVMRFYGSNVTWWRVTNAAGQFPAELLDRAREHWAQEGIEVDARGRGCDIAAYRVDEAAWVARYEAAVADLPRYRRG